MAYCFMMNNEYMRCINLIEKEDLMKQHEKFQILVGHCYIQMGCIGMAIKILENKVEENDIYPIETGVSMMGASGSEDGRAGPSSGFGIGSSSN